MHFLTKQQVDFFDTFGFIKVPGAIKDDVGWIAEEHAAVFADLGIVHTGETRTIVAPFIDQRERLCTVLDLPGVEGVLSDLIGEDFNYMIGDGNYFSGNSNWHSDGTYTIGTFVKLAIYLDACTAETGALRVIPGSHKFLDWSVRGAAASESLWGIGGSDVPAHAIETEPGDVVVFNHNTMHSSWGGGRARRMFTLNCCSRGKTPEEVAAVQGYVNNHQVFHMERMFTDVMRDTASPRRMRHLEQPISMEGTLPALTQAWRDRGEQPGAITGILNQRAAVS